METKAKPDQSTAQPLPVVIVERVADRENVDPLDLPPLHDTVDPDALSALFASPGKGPENVTFTYNGYRVTVEGPEQVLVDPLEDDSR